MFDGIEFAYPWVLYFLFLIPLMIVWEIKKGRRKESSITFSSFTLFKGIKPTLKERLVFLPPYLRLAAISFFLVAMARPQSFLTSEDVYAEGIDIVLALDISGSMLAEDFKPNRIEAAKNIVNEFIDGRTNDRIGLVIFAGESFTQCPLTIDYRVLKNLLKDIKSGLLQDGTAIGSAIATGVNRLKESDAESKVMILATDGVNNAGEVDPVTAAQIAETFGIRIYSIGVGARGEAPYPFQTPFGTRYQMVPVEIDEALLKQVAEATGGKYFRATSNKKLEEIYKEIDELEKTKIEVSSYRQTKEHFYGWLGGGLLFLFLEISLARGFLRKIP